MPTIEMHGFGEGFQRAYAHGLKKAVEMARLIRDQLREAKYREEVMISYGQSFVYNYQDEPRPFLRVWFTKHDVEHTEDLLHRLAPLGVRIECATLAATFACDEDPLSLTSQHGSGGARSEGGSGGGT